MVEDLMPLFDFIDGWVLMRGRVVFFFVVPFPYLYHLLLTDVYACRLQCAFFITFYLISSLFTYQNTIMLIHAISALMQNNT